MRFSVITPGISPYVTGGIQRHSFNLVRHLSRLGVYIDLYHTDFHGASNIDGLDGMNENERSRITSIAIPWNQEDRLPGHYIRDLKRFSRSALDILRTRDSTDFIIAKSLTGWALVEAKRAGEDFPPVGVNLHGFEMFQPPASFRSRLEAGLMRPSFFRHINAADYVFSYGGRITDLIEEKVGIQKDRIIEVPGGVDENWLVKTPSIVKKSRRFVFLGRYERRKAVEELSQVIASHPEWAEKAEFRFVGPIPVDKQIAMSHVSYSGSISDSDEIRRELISSDILVCPSHSEGMPNSIMEGMATGLAIIATDVGAVRLLVSESNGFLLSSSNVGQIAEAIGKILQMPDEQLFRLKNNSLGKIEPFRWASIAEQNLVAIQSRLS